MYVRQQILLISMLYKSKNRRLNPKEEILLLKKSVRELQEQLQEAYKRIKELGENNERKTRED